MTSASDDDLPRPTVVGIDGSRASDLAVRWASETAALHRRRLRIVHGFDLAAARAVRNICDVWLVAIHTWHGLRHHGFPGRPGTTSDPTLAATADAESSGWLPRWCEKYPAVEVIRKTPSAGPDLHLIYWSESAQLVVAGSRRRGGLRGLLMGSTSNIVVRHAHCPVLVAHKT